MNLPHCHHRHGNTTTTVHNNHNNDTNHNKQRQMTMLSLLTSSSHLNERITLSQHSTSSLHDVDNDAYEKKIDHLSMKKKYSGTENNNHKTKIPPHPREPQPPPNHHHQDRVIVALPFSDGHVVSRCDDATLDGTERTKKNIDDDHHDTNSEMIQRPYGTENTSPYRSGNHDGLRHDDDHESIATVSCYAMREDTEDHHDHDSMLQLAQDIPQSTTTAQRCQPSKPSSSHIELSQFSQSSSPTAAKPTVAETNGMEASVSSPRPPKKKVVRFTHVAIRKYAMTMGDNPAVSYGPPIGLSWEILNNDDLLEYHNTTKRPATHWSDQRNHPSSNGTNTNHNHPVHATATSPPTTYIDIDVYENERMSRRKKSIGRMSLNYYQRKDILFNAGFTIHDIDNIVKEMNTIKRRRAANCAFSPFHSLQYNMISMLSFPTSYHKNNNYTKNNIRTNNNKKKKNKKQTNTTASSRVFHQDVSETDFIRSNSFTTTIHHHPHHHDNDNDEMTTIPVGSKHSVPSKTTSTKSRFALFAKNHYK